MIFHYTKTPEPGWRDALYAIGGQPSTQASYLDLHWWAGEAPAREAEDQAIQRWVVWEMFPEAALTRTPRYAAQARELLTALHGPPPVTLRSWIVRNGHRQIRSRSLVSQFQWELFRTTGCWAQPYWIIQGVTGGHLWQFPPSYQMLLRLHGRPLNPPSPGNLPYAVWDGRVRAQLVRERALREWLESFSNRDATSRRDHHHKREQVEVEREGRRQLLAWLDQQMGNAARETGPMLGRADIPVRPDAEVTDEQMEAESNAFVHATPTDPDTI